MVTGMVLTVIPPIDRFIDAPTPIDPPTLMAAGVAGVGGAGGGGSREHAVAQQSRGQTTLLAAPRVMEGSAA